MSEPERRATGPTPAAAHASFAVWGRALPRPAGIVLAAGPGTGAGGAVVALLRAIAQATPDTPRVLVLTPSVLLATQWRHRLQSAGFERVRQVDAPSYRAMEVAAASDANPWNQGDQFVTTWEFMRRDRRFPDALRARWTAVVLDPLPAAFGGGGARGDAGSDEAGDEVGRGRAAMASALWRSAAEWVLALASHANADTPEGFAHASRATHIVRWRTAEHALARHRPAFVTVDWSAPERAFYDFLRDALERAGAARGVPAADVRRALQALGGSLYGANEALHRCGRHEGVPVDFPSALNTTWPPDPVRRGRTVDSDSASNAALLDPEVCTAALARLEVVSVDAKWQACAELADRLAVASAAPLVVYVETADTAFYLEDQFAHRGWRVDPAPGSDARRWTRETPTADGQRVQVLQTATTQGVELPATPHVVHYELPPDARRLKVRLTRFPVEEPGAPAPTHHFLVDDVVTTRREVENLLAAASAAHA